MQNNTFYNEILTDHNLHPAHKHELEDANYELEGVNPSCGDDIVLKLKIEDGKIADGAYVGDGCAISQASADMMLDLVIGRTIDEAKHLSDIFLRMIKGKITDEERDELEEAGVLQDISHMPARVKCAVLGWHTMDEIFDDPKKAEKKFPSIKGPSDPSNVCHM
ncbi:MAG: Fe-S cluster assembly sulfur transfer protein SufU [Bilifractor sp.]